MEPSAAVELFNNGPKHNVKYSTYTGDDDSTTEAHSWKSLLQGWEAERHHTYEKIINYTPI